MTEQDILRCDNMKALNRLFDFLYRDQMPDMAGLFFLDVSKEFAKIIDSFIEDMNGLKTRKLMENDPDGTLKPLLGKLEIIKE